MTSNPLDDLVYVALARSGWACRCFTADSRLLSRVGHLPFVRALPA
jgi:hypothetical protein